MLGPKRPPWARHVFLMRFGVAVALLQAQMVRFQAQESSSNNYGAGTPVVDFDVVLGARRVEEGMVSSRPWASEE
jgi:hypothetical protein